MSLLRALTAQGIAYPHENGLLSSLLQAHDKASLKHIISPKYVHRKVTTNPQISLTEMRVYLYSKQKYFSTTDEDIILFNSDIRAPTVGTESDFVSGDDNWKRVSERGAITGLTSGESSRPEHAKYRISSTDRLWHEKFPQKTLLNRVLLNQLLLSGVGFGKHRNWASLVAHEGHPSNAAGSGNSTEIYAIGTFI